MKHVPDCPYCDKKLDGPMVNGLHVRCNVLKNKEMARIWPDDYPPEPEVVGPDWTQPEGETLDQLRDTPF